MAVEKRGKRGGKRLKRKGVIEFRQAGQDVSGWERR
jgi:hypothetical protein